MDEQTPGQSTPDPGNEPVSNAPTGSGAPAPSAADEALLALAQRLLAPRYPHMPAPEHDPLLLVGRLPDTPLFAVPLPPESRVVGSLVADDTTTIVLDCGQPDMALLDFYRERMAEQGWQVPEMHHPPQGGFTFGAGGGVPLSYIHMCRADRLAGLQVTVLAREGQPTDVRLELSRYADPSHSPCAPQRRPRYMPSVLPLLVAPAGGSQSPEGGGGGSGHVTSSASVQTDLDLTALTAHYDQQLANGGWVRADGGTAGSVGWSAWTLQDSEGQPWRGMLAVLRESDAPGQYFLMVRASLVGESKQSGGGGFSWGMSSMTITRPQST